MYIVAIGWIYVVLMMSITEQSAIAGVITFLLYGVLPVSIILYLGGSKRRKRHRQAAEAAARSTSTSDSKFKSDSPSNQVEAATAAHTEPE